MSIPATVVLDEDVVERVRELARKKSIPFGTALNDLVRVGLAMQGRKLAPFKVMAVDPGKFLLLFPIKMSDVDELDVLLHAHNTAPPYRRSAKWIEQTILKAEKQFRIGANHVNCR